jgi:hypothetical protein
MIISTTDPVLRGHVAEALRTLAQHWDAMRAIELYLDDEDGFEVETDDFSEAAFPVDGPDYIVPTDAIDHAIEHLIEKVSGVVVKETLPS